jgi:dimethylamine monooxygenase subunit C
MSHRAPSALSTDGATAPAVDPTAHAIGMLAFGAAGMRVVRRWVQQAPPSTPVTWAAAQRADAVSLAELERQVAAAPAGWALMLAGPEADVRAAREAVLRLGMTEAEVRTAVTGEALRRVWCPHCTATTDTDVLPGDSVHCGGCTVPLRVPTSFSRSLGAHVGIAEFPSGPAHHVA